MISQKNANILAQQLVKDFLENCGARSTEEAEVALSMLATVATSGVVTVAGSNCADEMLSTIRDLVVENHQTSLMVKTVPAPNPTLMTVLH